MTLISFEAAVAARTTPVATPQVFGTRALPRSLDTAYYEMSRLLPLLTQQALDMEPCPTPTT